MINSLTVKSAIQKEIKNVAEGIFDGTAVVKLALDEYKKAIKEILGLKKKIKLSASDNNLLPVLIMASLEVPCGGEINYFVKNGYIYLFSSTGNFQKDIKILDMALQSL